ncbi:MAG: cytochrome c [Nitrospirales bacterium]|nr:cytochrome c [Nitrospirales bacterium]
MNLFNLMLNPRQFRHDLFSGILLLLFLLGGLPIPSIAAGESPGNPDNGKGIYTNFCAACHGAQGKGDGPAGKVLTPPPANFTDKKFKNKGDKELIETIQNGKPGTGMPPWKNSLSSQQIRDVLAFIRTLS